MVNLFNPIVILDANVLYPAPLRDFLLRLAATNLYKPKWTDEIQQEWISNLLINRPALSESKLRKTVKAMNTAFPDASVKGYRSLIKDLTLPDKDDRRFDLTLPFSLPHQTQPGKLLHKPPFVPV